MKTKIQFKGKDFFGAGVIVYHSDYLLLQKVKGRSYWEDFGGRTDKEDKNIIKTAFRECEEESNAILSESFLRSLIRKNRKKCYFLLQDNCYFIYMIYVTKKEKDELTSDRFGKMECHDKIEREVDWVKKGEVKYRKRIIDLE